MLSLIDLIKLHRTECAMRVYTALKVNDYGIAVNHCIIKRKSESVSLETQNSLLALLSHYGVGNFSTNGIIKQSLANNG